MLEALDGIPIVVAVIGLLVVLVGAGLLTTTRRSSRRGGRRPDGPTQTKDDGSDTSRAATTDTLPVPDERVDDDLDVALPEVPDTPEALVEEPPLSLGERFNRRLARTRNVLGVSVADLFGRGVDEAAWEGLEEILIGADVGVTATMEIVEELRRRSREEGATTPEAVTDLLKQQLRAALQSDDRSLARATDDGPTVWLVTGVNGTGKTTSIGKLAAIEQREQREVVLAAADTFRAAAAEQLGIWATRTGAHLVRKDEGADPGAVAFEAYAAAAERAADLLIVDTAGRLHNKSALMDELGKVKRVLEKQAGPLEETLLVLDATTGQNGIAQASAFMQAVDLTGVVLTKLDGSSKGGIVVAIQRELGLPVKLVGLGEDIDDLAPFDPELFVEGLFTELAD